jgi:hypothetical protein
VPRPGSEQATDRVPAHLNIGQNGHTTRPRRAVDRWLKPVEYAEAGIVRFWRIEPDDTVVQFRLDGGRYVEYGTIALDELLAGGVPDLT